MSSNLPTGKFVGRVSPIGRNPTDRSQVGASGHENVGLRYANPTYGASRAPIGYLAITQIPVAINQGYIAMLPSGALPPLYLLFWCKQNMDVIKNHANGSTFMEISKKVFRPLAVVIPKDQIIKEFIEIVDPLFVRITENNKKAQTLATLRDTLLPRLISGQLRLPDDNTSHE